MGSIPNPMRSYKIVFFVSQMWSLKSAGSQLKLHFVLIYEETSGTNTIIPDTSETVVPSLNTIS